MVRIGDRDDFRHGEFSAMKPLTLQHLFFPEGPAEFEEADKGPHHDLEIRPGLPSVDARSVDNASLDYVVASGYRARKDFWRNRGIGTAEARNDIYEYLSGEDLKSAVHITHTAEVEHVGREPMPEASHYSPFWRVRSINAITDCDVSVRIPECGKQSAEAL